MDRMERTVTSAEIIRLEGMVPFGVGGRRLCYTHPAAQDLCVKVLRQDDRRTIRMNRRTLIPAGLRRKYDNNAHELKVLTALFHRIGSAADQHLPRCYGMFDTDQGPGLVLHLVRDHDGRISRSLRELLSIGYDPQEFRPAFEVLGDFMLKHVVITRALLDHNVVARLRSDGQWQLYIIDGLGDRAWLPMATWLRPLGEAKVRRRLAEAWTRFEQFHRSGGVTPELISASSWGQGFLNHRGD